MDMNRNKEKKIIYIGVMRIKNGSKFDVKNPTASFLAKATM